MGDKYVATVRFHTEGVEAELYGRLMEGKKEAGLSVPDYIKQILKEYFENKDREDSRNEWLEQFGWEIAKVVEQTVKKCISGDNVNAMGTGTALMADTEEADNIEEAGLPEQSEEIPEGALDFLDGME
ncbi:hypothetical protein D7V86_21675 [bacterium D16-51]|nr:hypothetical protein D7V96_21530 [bacterium D16-59]RKI55405.1 hypothetical protein D7V86_21675 [bacterium D16-51]